MLVKINKQPIEVSFEDKEEPTFSWIYLCVSGVGFMSILSLLDYISYLFTYHHAIPFIQPITKFILMLLGL